MYSSVCCYLKSNVNKNNINQNNINSLAPSTSSLSNIDTELDREPFRRSTISRSSSRPPLHPKKTFSDGVFLVIIVNNMDVIWDSIDSSQYNRWFKIKQYLILTYPDYHLSLDHQYTVEHLSYLYDHIPTTQLISPSSRNTYTPGIQIKICQ